MEVDFDIERSIFQNLYVEDVHTSVFMLAKALITINGSSSSGIIDENISTHDGDSSNDDNMRSSSISSSSSSSSMKEQSLLKLNPSLRR
jgi:hypothetical protein